MSVVKRDPDCGWCVYHESDGHCTCKYKCSDCETVYEGSHHSQEECIAAMKKQLKKLKE